MAGRKTGDSSQRRRRTERAAGKQRQDANTPATDAAPHRADAAPERSSEEELQGPPPVEATAIRMDREREEELREQTASSPKLTGGDVDADWERADSVGEEAVGGSVATPDQDVVDDLGDALGLPRAPDEEIRTSQEILEARDRDRWKQEE